MVQQESLFGDEIILPKQSSDEPKQSPVEKNVGTVRKILKDANIDLKTMRDKFKKTKIN